MTRKNGKQQGFYKREKKSQKITNSFERKVFNYFPLKLEIFPCLKDCLLAARNVHVLETMESWMKLIAGTLIHPVTLIHFAFLLEHVL